MSIFGPVFDSHAHLDMIADRNRIPQEQFDLKKSMQPGHVRPHSWAGVIANFCKPKEWTRNEKNPTVLSAILRKSIEHDKTWIALSVHPHWSPEWNDEVDAQLRSHIDNNEREFNSKIVAVGEMGLDYSKNNRVRHRELQKNAFRKQIQIALDYQLPLILHIREAEDEGLAILSECNVPTHYKMHRHCFTGTVSQAMHWMQLYPNSVLGLTGLITMKGPRSDQARELARAIPMHRLVLETDSPHFQPPGSLGKCSRPTNVLAVAEQVSWIKQIPVAMVLRFNLDNVMKVYNISNSPV